MLVRRFYDDRLAQAAYLIGCQRTGEAMVIDPPRDTSALRLAAEEEGLRITKVSETHIHADFVSGARELAAVTGAQLFLSAEGGPDWQYGYAVEAGAQLVQHGDVITMGGVRLEVRHTPGHTPEHIVFIVTDTARSEEPVGMVSGDFLFVGDVGRPDLLEKAAKQVGTMESGARQLFASLQATGDLPDHLQIWPGHGAGSACGKALGAMPSSTLGYERRTNWAFGVGDEAAFVTAVLEGQPNPPAYFAMMKHINKVGAPILGDRGAIADLGTEDFAAAVAEGVVLDVRPKSAWAEGHLKGSIGIPLIKAFTTWAGWLLPYDRPIALIAASPADALAARTALASIGLDAVRGAFSPGAYTALAQTLGAIVARHGEINAATELSAAGRTVIDLREPNEWAAGHIPGAEHHPLGTVRESLAARDRATPLAIHCQGGTRSAIGASVLEAMGFTDVLDLTAGYAAWQPTAPADGQ